jgi:hypothetical protein
MTAGRNYNILTKKFHLKGTTGSAVTIGSSVAAGMNRYITFISVRQNAIAKGLGSKIWFCSVATSQGASTVTLASASEKFTVRLASAAGAHPKFFKYPGSGPDPENPLFSVAASKFCVARSSSTQAGSTSCTVFVQYYDR